jgi:hypothetical protein
MGSLSKTELQILVGMFGVQLALILTVGGLLAAVVPPSLAAYPLSVLALRSEQTVRMMVRRFRRAFIGIAVLATAAVASFIFADENLGFRLQVLRALLVDGTILWLAAVVAAQLHVARQRRSPSGS